jgi:hypothetical protein
VYDVFAHNRVGMLLSDDLLKILVQSVKKVPLSILNLPKSDWHNLSSARRGLSEFTVAKPHSQFDGLKNQGIVLMFPELLNEDCAYAGIMRSKQAVTTLDSRIAISSTVKLQPSSVSDLANLPELDALRRAFILLTSKRGTVNRLSPIVSTALITALWNREENRSALKFLARQLGPKTFRDGFALQQDAVELALKFFGHAMPSPTQAVIPDTFGTSLGSIRLLEDNIIEHDARSIPGMRLIRSDVTGYAEFEGGGDRLRVYTANKRPLEALFGVDLVYLNLRTKNLVLVQYKMLERAGSDWIFRPDDQLDEEIERMDLFRQTEAASTTSYRLNPEAFYMRFVKRDGKITSPAITMPIDHFKMIRANPVVGPRGGLQISYEALQGQYMREAGLVDLVKAGYIGCHCHTTAAFGALIDAVLQGGNAAVAAIQSKIAE